MNKKRVKVEDDSDQLHEIEDAPVPRKKKKNRKMVASIQAEPIIQVDSPLVDEDEEDSESIQNDIICDWAPHELESLICAIEQSLPPSDTSKWSTSIDRIDWDTIKVANRSAEECKAVTHRFLSKIRKYRTLSEMMLDAHKLAQNPFRSLNTGRIKHPGQPKKPMTPFLRYFTEKRQKYHDKYPELSMMDLSKYIATKFSQLPEKRRNKYKQIYDQEMEEFRVKKAEFRAQHPELFQNRPKPKVSDPGPRKPRTPFQMYAEKKTRGLSDEERKAVVDGLRETWNNLSENKRLKFIRKSVKDKNRYTSELEEYQKENPSYKAPKMRIPLNKTELELLDRADGKPEKPPINGYMLFSKIMLSEVTEVPAKEKMIVIARRWKEMSDEEKAEYNQEAALQTEQYNEKFEIYLQGLSEEDRERVLSETKSGRERGAQQKKEKEVIDSTALMAYQMQELVKMQKLHPDKSKAQLMQMLNEQWSLLDQDQKQQYLQLAESIKDFMPQTTLSSDSAKADLTRRKDPVELEFLKKIKIKKPRSNGFAMFCSMMMPKMGVDVKKRMRVAAQMWKDVSKEEKEKYNSYGRERFEKYKKALEHYRKTNELPDKALIDDMSMSIQQENSNDSIKSEPETNGDIPSKNKKANTSALNNLLYNDSGDSSDED